VPTLGVVLPPTAAPNPPAQTPDPTPAPTPATPAPTTPTPAPADPTWGPTEAGACEVEGDNICRSTASDESCALETTCIRTSGTGAERRAQSLEFSYIPDSGGCNGNNNQGGFQCTTFVATDSFDNVYINVTQTSGESIVENLYMTGDIFAVPLGLSVDDNNIDFQIYSVTASNVPDVLLQSFRLSVRCRSQADLTILNTFGSLQLVRYCQIPNP
jgi:hypothetical protein